MPIRRSSRAQAPQRRKLVWARQLITVPVFPAAGAVTAINLLADFAIALGAEPIGCTIMRIRGHLAFRSSTAGNQVRAVAGIIKGPQTMTSVNLDPVVNAHHDWMYWEAFQYEPVVATEFATLNMHTVDVKSRRKVDEIGDTVFLVVKNTHPADAVNYTYSMSTLLALP